MAESAVVVGTRWANKTASQLSTSRSPSRSRSEYSSASDRSSQSSSGSRSDRSVSSSRSPEEEATKDQPIFFVSQLVMRADERDIGRYFRRKIEIEVRDVIRLRDKRTGRHKGCAYVEEVGRLEDIDRALGATGKTPDFQRFRSW